MTNLTDEYRANFNTLLRAAKNGDLALLDCTDAVTGAPVPTIVCVERSEDGMVNMVPIAKLFTGNPYEEINPPT